ncbi:tandem-95 repeat protein [Arcobacter sp. YIC-464]|uniref:tandem-95 repeat protein n=1 Tax=Arcobacter sp. YIC-464 TaxID=3376631 RepID=UPI003C185AB6
MVAILKGNKEFLFNENQTMYILDNIGQNEKIEIKISSEIKYSSQLVENDLFFEFTDNDGNPFQLILKDMATLLAQNDGDTLVQIILLGANAEEKVLADISDLATALQASAAGGQQETVSSDTYNNPGFNNASDNGLENRNYDNARVGGNNNLPSNAVGNQNAQDVLDRRNFAPKIDNIKSQVVDEDGTLVFTFNATDRNNDSLSTLATSSDGSVVINGNEITFTPTENFNGQTSITLSVSDGKATTTKIIKVTVSDINDAPKLDVISVLEVDEDGSKTITFTASDIDGTVNTIAEANNGTVVINGNEIKYAPTENYNGSDTITVTTIDDDGAKVVKNISVTVNSINDAPIIESKTVSVFEDGLLSGTINASDVDLPLGEKLVFSTTDIVDGFSIDQDGNYEFDASEYDYLKSGQEEIFNINIDVEDELGLKSTNVLTIKVTGTNDTPTLEVESTIIVDEDGSKTITFNASDIDGTINTTAEANNGTVVINGNEIAYTPNENYNGSDTITVTTIDNDGAKVVKTVSVTINDINDAPTLEVVSTLEVDEDGSKTITFTANDVDGIVNTTAVANNGLVEVNGNEIRYTPNENYNGSDTITVTTIDNDGAKVVKTVSVTINDINDAPTLEVVSVLEVDEDGSKTITFTANDVDGTVNTTAEANNGTVVITGNEIKYTPTENYNGSDTITVTTIDDDGVKVVKTVSVTVNDINDTPTLEVESTIIVDEDGSKTITFNASDIDGTINTTAEANNGTVVINGNEITYTPNENYNGSDTITVTTIDNDGAKVVKTVSVTINDINDAPTLEVVSTLEVDEDGSKTITFTASDVDGTVNTTAEANNGTVVITGNEIKYTPNADYNGSDTITITTIDDDGAKVVKTIAVTVNSVNDAPIVTSYPSINVIETDLTDATAEILNTIITTKDGVISLNISSSNDILVKLFDQYNVQSVFEESILTLLPSVRQDDIKLEIDKSVEGKVSVKLDIEGLPNNPFGTVISNENLNKVLLSKLGGAFNLPLENAVYEGNISVTDIDNIENVQLALTEIRLSVKSSNKNLISIFEELKNYNTDSIEKKSLTDIAYVKSLINDFLNNVKTNTTEEKTIEIPAKITALLYKAGLLNIVLENDGSYKIVSPLFNSLKETDSMNVSFDYIANDGISSSNKGTTTVTIKGVNDIPVAIEDNVNVEIDSTSYTGSLPGNYLLNMLSTITKNVDTTNGINSIINQEKLKESLINSVLGNKEISTEDLEVYNLYKLLNELETSKESTVNSIVNILETYYSDTDNTVILKETINTFMKDYSTTLTDLDKQNSLNNFHIKLIGIYGTPITDINIFENIKSATDPFVEKAKPFPNTFTIELLKNLDIKVEDYNPSEYSTKLLNIQTQVSFLIENVSSETFDINKSFKDLMEKIDEEFGFTSTQQEEANYIVELISNSNALITLISLDPKSLIDIDSLLGNLGINLTSLDQDSILDILKTDLKSFMNTLSLKSLIEDTDAVKSLFKDFLNTLDGTVDNIINDILKNSNTNEALTDTILKQSIYNTLTDAIMSKINSTDASLRDVVFKTVEKLTADTFKDLTVDSLKMTAKENIFEQLGLDKGLLVETTRNKIAEDMVDDIFDRLKQDEDLQDIFTLNYELVANSIVTKIFDENGNEVTNLNLSPTQVVINDDGSYTITNSDFDSLSTLWKVEVSFDYKVNDGSASSEAKTIKVNIDFADNINSGTSTDGYISGATIFSDANENGILDLGEAKTVSDAKGDFELVGAKGTLYSYGGTDILTGLAFEGIMSAPEGSSIISPLTTLVVNVMKLKSLSIDEAQTLVKSSLGLSSGIDLNIFDPISVILNSNSSLEDRANALAVQNKTVQIVNIVSQTSSALKEASESNILEDKASLKVVEVIAKKIEEGQNLDLTNINTIDNIVSEIEVNNEVSFSDKTDIVEVTTNINKAMNDAKSIKDLAKLQQVAEDIESDIENDGDITKSLTQSEIETASTLKTVGNLSSNEALLNPIVQENDLEDITTKDSTYNGKVNSFENAINYSLVNSVILTFTSNSSELYAEISSVLDENSLSIELDNSKLEQLKNANILEFILNSDGTYKVVSNKFSLLDTNDDLKISFDYQANIEGGTISDIQTINLTIVGKNYAPTLEVVSILEVDEDGSKTITFTANDVDGTVNTTAEANNGTVVITGNEITYTPTENYNGSDTITVTTIDDDGAKVVKTVSVTVNDINDTPTLEVVSTITVDEDGSKTITFNAYDVEGTVTTTAVANNGLVEVNGNEIKYTPNENYNGSDTITVTTIDDDGAKVVKTVSVTVNSVNDAPTLEVVSTLEVDEDGSKTITFNASDIDGTVNTTAVANNGTVVITGNEIKYTPNENYNGSDTITVTTTDNDGAKVIKTIAVTVNDVNDAPTLEVVSSTTVDEDGSKTVTFTANDVDGTVNTTVEANNGIVVITGNEIKYTPNADYNGSDTITVTTIDDDGAKVVKNIVVTVNSVNDAPTLEVVSAFSMAEDGSKTITFNAYDVEGTVTTTAVANNGLVEVNGNEITYIPNADYSGADTITLTTVDESGLKVQKVIAVTINDINELPTLEVVSTITVDEDGTKTITFSADDVDGTVSTTAVANNGVVVINGNELIYTPNADYYGLDTITLTATDDRGAKIQKTIAVTVNDINELPTLEIVSTITVDEDGSKVISYNAFDIDGSISSILATSINGVVNINETTNELEYIPNANYNGSDKITIELIDNSGAKVTKEISVEINPVNDNPVINDIVKTISEVDEAVLYSGKLEASDIDTNSVVSFEVSNKQISNALYDFIIVLDSKTGEFDIEGDFNSLPKDMPLQISFDYNAIDENGAKSETKTVTINVVGVNDAPTISDFTYEVETNELSNSFEGYLPGAKVAYLFNSIEEINPLTLSQNLQSDILKNMDINIDTTAINQNNLIPITFNSLGLTALDALPALTKLTDPLNELVDSLKQKREALPSSIKIAIYDSLGALEEGSIKEESLETQIATFIKDLESKITSNQDVSQEDLEAFANTLFEIYEAKVNFEDLVSISQSIEALQLDIETSKNSLVSDIVVAIETQLKDNSKTSELSLKVGQLLVQIEEEPSSSELLLSSFVNDIFDVMQASVNPTDIEIIAQEMNDLFAATAINPLLNLTLASDIINVVETQIADTSKNIQLSADVNSLLTQLQVTPQNKEVLVQEFLSKLFVTYESSVTPSDLEPMQTSIQNIQASLSQKILSLPNEIIKVIETQIDDSSKTSELTLKVQELMLSLEATPENKVSLLEAFGLGLFDLYDSSVKPVDLIAIQSSLQNKIDEFDSLVTTFPTTFTQKLLEVLGVDVNDYIEDGRFNEYLNLSGKVQFEVSLLMSNALKEDFDLNSASQNLIENSIETFGLSKEQIVLDNFPDSLKVSIAQMSTIISSISKNDIVDGYENNAKSLFTVLGVSLPILDPLLAQELKSSIDITALSTNPNEALQSIKSALDDVVLSIKETVDTSISLNQNELDSLIVDFIKNEIKLDYSSTLSLYKTSLEGVFGEISEESFDELINDMVINLIETNEIINIEELKELVVVNVLENAGLDYQLIDESYRMEYSTDLLQDLVVNSNVDIDLLDSFVYTLDNSVDIVTKTIDSNGVENTLEGTNVKVNPDGTYEITNSQFDNIDSSLDIEISFNYKAIDEHGAISESKEVNISIDLTDTYNTNETEVIDMSTLLANTSGLDELDISNGEHILSNFSLDEFIALTDSDNTLRILGDEADSIKLEAEQNWEIKLNIDGSTYKDADGFHVYTTTNTHDEVLKLLIEDSVTVEI